MKRILLLTAAALVAACADGDVNEVVEDRDEVEQSSATATMLDAGYGKIELSGADNPFPAGAVVRDLGGAFGWSEGPVWIDDAQGGYLLFTDVPGNTIHKYDPSTEAITEWMKPSGAVTVTETMSSPGANGLFPHGEGKILVPDHGNRALYSLDLATKEKTVLADRYAGKRLNSPNDVVVHSSGALFFTDPPYGLKGGDDSEAKELDFNGVFRLDSDGTLSVVDQTLTRPNGIALSPDESMLYVANSQPTRSFIRYPVDAEGEVGRKVQTLDVTAHYEEAGFGNPDGMAVATDGTIFVTGPAGVYVLTPEFETIARIKMPKPCANVAFGGPARSTLYMTCYDRLTSVETTKTGL